MSAAASHPDASPLGKAVAYADGSFAACGGGRKENKGRIERQIKCGTDGMKAVHAGAADGAVVADKRRHAGDITRRTQPPVTGKNKDA